MEISNAVDDAYREIEARRIQGQMNWKLGKTREALADFNKALERAQEWRALSSSSDVRASMMDDEQFAFRGLLDIALANVAKRRRRRTAPRIAR